jgi:hypothetical protein
MVMIVGIIVLGIVMMRMFHQRERHLQSLAGRIASDLEEARALRGQLDEVHVRVSNLLGMAQRLGSRLDDRVASLDVASLKMHATRTALPRMGAPGPTDTRGAVRQLSPAPLAANANDGISSPPVMTRSSSAATLEAKPALDPLTRQVYAMADAGRAPVLIARDLNEQVGKVELILALRRQSA